MTARTTTIMSATIIAGPMRASDRPRHEVLGQQIAMSDDLKLFITPEIAQQWLPVITKIAEEK